jgi:hypothetical protein
MMFALSSLIYNRIGLCILDIACDDIKEIGDSDEILSKIIISIIDIHAAGSLSTVILKESALNSALPLSIFIEE